MECWDDSDLIPMSAVSLLFLQGLAEQMEDLHWWAIDEKESNASKRESLSKETMD